MRTVPKKVDSRFLVGLFVLSLGILVADLFTPLGVAVGTAYVMPVFITLWAGRRLVTLVAATASTAFIILDIWLSPAAGVTWMVIANRLIAVGLVWIVAVLALLRRQAEEEQHRLIAELRAALQQVRTLRGLLPVCASCKKIRDTKGYWNRVDEYLEGHSEAQVSFGICPECMADYHPREQYPELYSKEN